MSTLREPANSGPEFDAEGVMKWERVVPPYFWANANKLVVADRHLPDGSRQHMVPGHVAAGVVVGNAQLIGQLDALDAQYSTQLSHLSEVSNSST